VARCKYLIHPTRALKDYTRPAAPLVLSTRAMSNNTMTFTNDVICFKEQIDKGRLAP
jgi:hypothetical protein